MDTTPRIYYAEDVPFIMNWVAEGTDGRLYVVPAQPGGWLQRDDFKGCPDELVPVSQPKASTIAWFVYGDVGNITIASR